MSKELAVFGGAKMFPEGLPFTQPSIPAWEEVSGEFEAMYRSGWLTKGPQLQKFEEAAAAYLGVKHVVGVGSCTAGLILAIQSLQLPAGGEVIVPSFTFMATFHSLFWNGLKPVFVDVEPDTFTVDVEAIERAITPETVGIMVASTFGNPPAWEKLEELAAARKLPIFSDSAHGMGTVYQGKRLGGHGAFEVFSLSPTKLLAAGEGGVVATNRDDIAAWVRAGRDYGNPGSYDCPHVGLNGRMSEFHAILARKAMAYLDEYAQNRNRIVTAYKERLGQLPGITFQTIRAGARSSYKDFAVLVDSERFGLDRDLLGKVLAAEGIPTRAYFHPAGHQLTPYLTCKRHNLTETERISAQVICPPISSHMSLDNVEKVCAVVAEVYAQRERLSK